MLLDFHVIQMFGYIKILVLAAALQALKWPRFLVIFMLCFSGLQWLFFQVDLESWVSDFLNSVKYYQDYSFPSLW